MTSERGCEHNIDGKTCGGPISVFVMGQNRCAVHDPKGDPSCSHSLAPSGRCAFCGARAEAVAADLDTSKVST